MDRKGIFGLLICGILFALHLYYSTIQEAEKQKLAAEQKTEETLNKAEEADTASIGEEGEAGAAVANGDGPQVTAPGAVSAAIPEEEFRLETEKVTFVLTNKGGGIKYAEFKEQKAVVIASERKKLTKEQLANPELVHLNRYGKAAVGALMEGGVDSPLGLTYKLVDKNATSVTFAAKTSSGLVVGKTWTLVKINNEADQYRIDLKMTLKNGNAEGNVELDSYGVFAGSAGPLYSDEDLRGTGMFFFDKSLHFYRPGFKKYMVSKARTSFKEEQPDVSYVGVSNQFFSTMVASKKPINATIWAKPTELELEKNGGGGEKKFMSLAWSLPDETLAPNEVETINYEVFMGPKDNKVVRQLGQGRGELMHYGFFSIISRPLNWLLNFYHDFIFSKIANKWAWGFAIILVTFTIRLVIWPLHNASTRTMKRMSKLQPLMAELKEKYADDPQKVQTETMKLYKQYDINPVGGCLPMFAQIPIFFGFYSMLRSAVELRGAEFLWVNDLALPDTVLELPFGLPMLGDPVPINLLPLLMMVTMFIQMQMTPKTGDPMQRRIFMLMPFMFFFFCYNFASALALYWTAQNCFSIGQTWLMQRQPEVDLKERKPGKKSFMQKMAAKAEEVQKAQEQSKKCGSAKKQAPAPKSKKPRGPKTGG